MNYLVKSVEQGAESIGFVEFYPDPHFILSGSFSRRIGRGFSGVFAAFLAVFRFFLCWKVVERKLDRPLDRAHSVLSWSTRGPLWSRF